MSGIARGERGRRDGGSDEPLVLPISQERRQRIEGISPGLRPRNGDDNVSLWLDKYVVRNGQTWKIEKADRVRAFGRYCQRWTSEMGKQAGVRQEAMLKDLHRDGAYRRFEANVTGRLLVDYGQATATEVAISFHRMWGVPRIPGSALKGASRAYALLGGEWLHDTIETYFGSDPGTQPLKLGCITFYDALPVDGSFELAMDVLTPHHQEYYQGKQAPVEWEDPIPFTFLSVVKTRFVFSVGVFPQPGEKRNASERIERAEMAGKLLKETLELGGVGAKTSAGYGYFSGFADR